MFNLYKITSTRFRLSSYFLRNNIKGFTQFSSKRKGIQENVKQKQIKLKNQSVQPQKQNNFNFLELTDMKILNMQFFPISLLLTPCFLYMGEFQHINYLIGIQMAEKYASVAMCMNLDFNNKKLEINQNKLDKVKVSIFIIASGILHCLPGYYNLITSIGLSMLTIMAPFKFLIQSKEQYSQIQIRRNRNMNKIKMSYFFIFVFLGLLKALHYEQTYGIEMKLKQFDKENNGIAIRK